MDDDADTREMLRVCLQNSGIESDVATTGEDALLKAVLQEPDAIILDIGLPNIDGYEVCRRLRARLKTKSTAIIGLTGWADKIHQERAREVGFSSVLLKPCPFDTLLAELQRHLGWTRSR